MANTLDRFSISHHHPLSLQPLFFSCLHTSYL
jgi:hypothetical protein